MSRYGYSACVLVGTATYALIIPMLWLVPRGLKERKEGEDDFEDLKSDSRA